MEYLVLRVTIPFEFSPVFQLDVSILTRRREIWLKFRKLVLPEKICIKVMSCKSSNGDFDHLFTTLRLYKSPVSPVFHIVVTVRIGLKTQLEWEHPIF